jgi:hypothetical protein
MPYSYQKIDEQYGYRLLRRDDGRYSVIAILTALFPRMSRMAADVGNRQMFATL